MFQVQSLPAEYSILIPALNITFREAGNFIEKINISNPVIIKLYIVPILFNITKIIRNALNIPHTNYYKFISLTTNFYSLLQTSTTYYKLLQLTTNFYNLLQTSTTYYKLLQLTTNFYNLLQTSTVFQCIILSRILFTCSMPF